MAEQGRRRKAAGAAGAPGGARPASEPEALGPGLYAASIEMKGARSYRVRTPSGAKLTAVLGEHVAPALADECLRTGRPVILAETDRGPTILGALQTQLPVERSEGGVLTLEADEVRLRAERQISIEVGAARWAADAKGVVRVEGDRMVIDMAALVRVLSSQVELP